MDDLLRRIPSRLLAEWQAFYSMERFGGLDSDRRAAMIAGTIANAYRDRDRHPEPFTLEDFMPSYTEAEPTGVDSSSPAYIPPEQRDAAWLEMQLALMGAQPATESIPHGDPG